MPRRRMRFRLTLAILAVTGAAALAYDVASLRAGTRPLIDRRSCRDDPSSHTIALDTSVRGRRPLSLRVRDALRAGLLCAARRLPARRRCAGLHARLARARGGAEGRCPCRPRPLRRIACRECAPERSRRTLTADYPRASCPTSSFTLRSSAGR